MRNRLAPTPLLPNLLLHRCSSYDITRPAFVQTRFIKVTADQRDARPGVGIVKQLPSNRPGVDSDHANPPLEIWASPKCSWPLGAVVVPEPDIHTTLVVVAISGHPSSAHQPNNRRPGRMMPWGSNPPKPNISPASQCKRIEGPRITDDDLPCRREV
ncbi:hypothetical protein LZ31DRAFT_232902 [Colletotrichum somersetense]|nr:hypothetical protein LZ31DRAFT_232902 [Colletotrichum somersetense]